LTKVAHFFDKIADAIAAFPGMSRSSIIRVHDLKTVYNGFRCFLVPRGDPAPREPKDIGETSAAAYDRVCGMIAEIRDGVVTEVFRTQRDVVKVRGIHEATVSNAVKHGIVPKNGCRYTRFAELSAEMKAAFPADRLPVHIPSKANGHPIQKLDPATMEVVHTYPSQDDARAAEKMSVATLKKCIRDGTVHNGNVWRSM
jgi:hypothetical protein